MLTGRLVAGRRGGLLWRMGGGRELRGSECCLRTGLRLIADNTVSVSVCVSVCVCACVCEVVRYI